MPAGDDPCNGRLHPRALAGLLLFNEGKYFEAHEALEDAWRVEPGPIRQLYQGILEAGVTYLHITRCNYPGAIKVCGRSQRWLKLWPEVCRGVQVGQLRRDLESAIAEVRRLGPGGLAGFDLSLLKPVAYENDTA